MGVPNMLQKQCHAMGFDQWASSERWCTTQAAWIDAARHCFRAEACTPLPVAYDEENMACFSTDMEEES